MNRSFFTSKIMEWYGIHKRFLPWRESKDPYRIWLSEVIMQQTRIDQGTSYYLRFIDRFPSVSDLALADEEFVLKNWQGLGYYSRARNLHSAAKAIMSTYGGVFPHSFSEIIKLKGVGVYTAAAIASIAFGESVPAIDGNALRLFSRFFGIEEAVDSSSGRNSIEALARDVIDCENPGDFNQAVMDFGALQCVPKSPKCPNCPLVDRCFAFHTGKVDLIPLKKGKICPVDRFINYIIVCDQHSFLMKKRGSGDIWNGLYDFPLEESDKLFTVYDLKDSEVYRFVEQNCNVMQVVSGMQAKHRLTHQLIHAAFWIVEIDSFNSFTWGNFVIVEKKNLQSIPVPKLIERQLLLLEWL